MNANLGSASWRKSTYSGTNNAECVELATGRNAVGMRDSKNPGTALVFPPGAVRVFLSGVRSGEFDLPDGFGQ